MRPYFPEGKESGRIDPEQSEGSKTEIATPPAGARDASRIASSLYARLRRALLAMTALLGTLSMIAVTTTALYGSEDDDTVTEVVDVTRTRVIVREHPKTGTPYVSVVSIDEPVPKSPFGFQGKAVARPDYRMLDPNVKEGQIPYEGPFSDRRKVTLFAATLMTAGAVGGAVGIAAAPAATGAGAAGGGGYLAAGAAVTGAGVAGAHLATKENPEDDEFMREAKSELDLASVREAGKT